MSSTRWPPSANRTRLAILILLVGIQFGFLAAAAEARSAATIRAALLSVGFDQAVSASGARHLDADLTSWGFASTADSFVAAYYLVSELRDQLLGPLYISVYRRQTGRWVHASGLEDDSGSVLDVQPHERYILAELHHNPSASRLLVVDSTTARVVKRLWGFHPRMLSDDVILFTGGMVHFAPAHQEQLLAFDAKTGTETEVFPGAEATAMETEYQQSRQATYDRLPEAARAEYYRRQENPVTEFDRSISDIAERAGGGRIAFVVLYSSMAEEERWPRLQTVGSCDLRAAGQWLCVERRVDEVSRQVGVPVRLDSERWFNRDDLDALIQALLKRQ